MPTYRLDGKRYAPGGQAHSYMAEIPVLTCPVCDRSAGVRERIPADPETLKEAAWDHLTAHRIDESKRAIYAVMMVERRGQLTLEADEMDERAGVWVDGFSQLTA